MFQGPFALQMVEQERRKRHMVVVVHMGEKYGIDGKGIHALIPQIANNVPAHVNQIFAVD